MFYKRLHFFCRLKSAIKIGLPHLQASVSQRLQISSLFQSSLIEISHDFIECFGRIAFWVTMPVIAVEFHHYLLVPGLVVLIDFVWPNHFFSLIFSMLDLYICLLSMVFYPLHGFADCLSFGRYPCAWRYRVCYRSIVLLRKISGTPSCKLRQS